MRQDNSNQAAKTFRPRSGFYPELSQKPPEIEHVKVVNNKQKYLLLIYEHLSELGFKMGR
jgi:hypothetical protein